MMAVVIGILMLVSVLLLASLACWAKDTEAGGKRAEDLRGMFQAVKRERDNALEKNKILSANVMAAAEAAKKYLAAHESYNADDRVGITRLVRDTHHPQIILNALVKDYAEETES